MEDEVNWLIELNCIDSNWKDLLSFLNLFLTNPIEEIPKPVYQKIAEISDTLSDDEESDQIWNVINEKLIHFSGYVLSKESAEADRRYIEELRQGLKVLMDEFSNRKNDDAAMRISYLLDVVTYYKIGGLAQDLRSK